MIWKDHHKKLCSNVENDGIEELKNKIDELENKINSGNLVINNNMQRNHVGVDAHIDPQNKIIKKENTIKLKPIQGWNDIVDNFKTEGKVMLYTNLLNTNLGEINDMTVGIEFPKGITSFGKTVLERPENMQEIEKQVSILKGKTMRIKLVDKNTDLSKLMDKTIEGYAKKNDVNLDVIE